LEPCPRMHARAKHGVGLERCRGRAAHPISCNQMQLAAIGRNWPQSDAIRRKVVVPSPRCNLRGAISEVPSPRCHLRGAISEVQSPRCHLRGAISEVQSRTCHRR
jgi:hypothetical protein